MKAIFMLPCLLAMQASAAVVYSGLQDIAIPTTTDGVYLNIDTGATSSTEATGWDINPFFGGFAVGNSSAFEPVRSGTGNSDSIVTVPLGSIIDGSLLYTTGDAGSSTHMSTVGGTFVPGQDAYIGFQFTPDGGGSPLFGWMRVEFTVNQPGALIRDWAYETNGNSITVGQVPEPTSVGLVALGSLALLRRKRR